MALGSRTRKARKLDGRRCSLCKKVAKDKVGNKYLCRIHSPDRLGYTGNKE